MADIHGPGQVYILRLACQERQPNLLLTDLTNFLNDLNLLYEYSRMLIDHKYDDYKFSRFSSGRNERRLSSEEQLSVGAIVHRSPLDLTVIAKASVEAMGAIWILVQTIDKITNWRLDRNTRELQLEKLRRELQLPSEIVAPVFSEHELFMLLRRRRATRYFRDLWEKLAASPIQVLHLEIGSAGSNPPEGGITEEPRR